MTTEKDKATTEEARRRIPLTYDLVAEAHHLHDKHCNHHQAACALGPSEIWSLLLDDSVDPVTEPLLETAWEWIERAYDELLARAS